MKKTETTTMKSLLKPYQAVFTGNGTEAQQLIVFLTAFIPVVLLIIFLHS